MFLKVSKGTLINLNNVVAIYYHWREDKTGLISFTGADDVEIKNVVFKDKGEFDNYIENNINPLIISKFKGVD